MHAHSIVESESANELSRYLRHPGALKTPLASPAYQRRKPEESVLHRVVGRNLYACLDAAQERSEHGFGYPAFALREFSKYFDCDQLRRGFVRVKCA